MVMMTIRMMMMITMMIPIAIFQRKILNERPLTAELAQCKDSNCQKLVCSAACVCKPSATGPTHRTPFPSQVATYSSAAKSKAKKKAKPKARRRRT